MRVTEPVSLWILWAHRRVQHLRRPVVPEQKLGALTAGHRLLSARRVVHPDCVGRSGVALKLPGAEEIRCERDGSATDEMLLD